MNNNSRTKNSFINSIVGSSSQIISTLLNFFVRTIFIYCLSKEYLGVNGLFSNILYMLNFAELGIGSAIVYKLYKPVANDDEERIKSLVSLYKKVYFIIGSVILILGLLVIPFMSYIIKEPPKIEENLILIYILYLLETVGEYFWGYKRSVLLVYQKNYINSAIDLLFSIIKSLVQALILIFTKNYILYLLVYILSTICSNLFISIYTNKQYPFLKEKNIVKIKKEEIKELLNNVKSLFTYKLGSTILSGTDNIILSMVVGISAVGMYSNYSLIITAVSGILWTILTGLTGSIGNLNALSDSKKSKEIYLQVLFVSCLLYGLGCLCIGTLINPFIELWIGSEYLLSNSIVILLIIILYLRGIVYPDNAYRDTLGLFKEGRIAPLISSFINIILSAILGNFLGIEGVFLASVLSILSTTFWYMPKVIFKNVFNDNIVVYFKKLFKFSFPIIIMYIISYILVNSIRYDGVLAFACKALIVFIICILTLLLESYNEECRNIKKSVFNLLRKKEGNNIMDNKMIVSREDQRKIQLNGLLYIKRICEENDIKYFLASGTLLGAVKYKGYIPWDDDIDICLFRSDYLRLIDAIEKDNNPDFEMLTVYNTKDYYYPYAKLVHKRTKLLDNAKEIKKMGVFIDIFPMDSFNSNVEEIFKKYRFLRNLTSKRMKIKNNIEKSNFLKPEKKEIKYKFIKDLIYEIVHIISLPLGYNYWAKLLDKKLSQKKGYEYVAILYKDVPKIFPFKLFQEISEYEFEGYRFTSVKNYDCYLSTIYGKYKKDLPKNKQITHHQLYAEWRGLRE